MPFSQFTPSSHVLLSLHSGVAGEIRVGFFSKREQNKRTQRSSTGLFLFSSYDETLSLSLPRVSFFFLLISVAHNVSFSPSNSFPPTNNQLSHGSLSHKFFCCISLESQAFFFQFPIPLYKNKHQKKKTSFYNKSKWYFFSLFSRSTHVFIADGPFLKTKGVN